METFETETAKSETDWIVRKVVMLNSICKFWCVCVCVDGVISLIRGEDLSIFFILPPILVATPAAPPAILRVACPDFACQYTWTHRYTRNSCAPHSAPLSRWCLTLSLLWSPFVKIQITVKPMFALTCRMKKVSQFNSVFSRPLIFLRVLSKNKKKTNYIVIIVL